MTDKIRLWEVLHGKQVSCIRNCENYQKCRRNDWPMKLNVTDLNFQGEPDKHYIYCDKWEPKNGT